MKNNIYIYKYICTQNTLVKNCSVDTYCFFFIVLKYILYNMYVHAYMYLFIYLRSIIRHFICTYLLNIYICVCVYVQITLGY